MNKIGRSLKNINWRLFTALLIMGLCPTVYTTVRTFFLGQLPGDWAYSIAGQLSWVSLIYEVVNEAIILPLFFFIGKVASDKKEFTNRLKTGLLISFGIYSLLSAIIMIFARQMLVYMAADKDIIAVAMDESLDLREQDAVVQVFFVRDGKLIGREHFYLRVARGDTKAQVKLDYLHWDYSFR